MCPRAVVNGRQLLYKSEIMGNLQTNSGYLSGIKGELKKDTSNKYYSDYGSTMKSEIEKSAILLTIPSLVGIVAEVLWRCAPLPVQHWGLYDYLLAAVVLLLDLCWLAGFFSALGFFDMLIKSRREIRREIVIAGFIINMIWIIYVVLSVIFMGPLNMQGGGSRAKVPSAILIK